MPENIQKEVPKKDSAGKQGTVHPFFVGGHGHKAESAQKKKKLKDQAINNDDVEYVEEVVEIVDDSKTQRPKRRSARRVLDDEVDEQVISLIEEEAATWSTKTRELTAEEKLRKKELDQQKLRQEVQDSQKLSAALYDGKAVNPFFAQKKQRGRIETKEDEQQGKAMGLLLTETLWPEYFNSHVGYTFQRPTRPLQISGFNLRSDDETRRLAEIMKVEFRTKTLMSQLGMATSCETPITIYKSLSKQDLESFLYSHYSPRVLAAPSCTKLVAQLLATDSNISLQKNTKDLWTTQYAPKSMVDLLGEQNRVIARKVRDRLNGFRPLSAETKARLTQKRSKKRGRNDTDSEDFITSDDSYSMDEDSESETGEANKIITSKHTLLIGPTGSGKSALLQAVANDCKLTIIEIHTGMKRSAKDVVAMLGETTSTRVVGGKKRALMGNDGWFGVMKRLEAQDAVVEVIDSDAVEEKNSRKKKVKASAVDFFAKRVPVPKKRSVPVTQKTPTPQIPKALVSTSSNPEVKVRILMFDHLSTA